MRRRTFLNGAGMAGLGAIAGMSGCLTNLTGGGQWSRKVGLAAPTSGPLGVLGGPVIEGGRVALDAVRDEYGADLEQIIGDTEANPEAALSVGRDMRDEGAVVISNLIVSDVGLALREFAEEEEIPCVGTFTGNTGITQDGTEYFFRQGGNNEQYAAGTIQFFLDQNVDSIAIISLNDSYGNTIVEKAKSYASQVGINVAYDTVLPPGTTNFRPELSNIENDAIGGIYVPYHGLGQTNLAEQLRIEELFADNIIVGDYAWGGIATFKNAAGENAEGIHFHGVDLRASETRAVADRITEELGGQVGTYRIVGYDTAKLSAQAVMEAGEVNPSAVKDTLRNVDYEGVSGWPVRFNDSGDNDAFQLIVNKWETSGGDIQASAPVFRSSEIPGDDAASILG